MEAGKPAGRLLKNLDGEEIHEQEPCWAMSAWMEVKEIFCIQRRTRGLGSRCLGPAHQSSSVVGSFQGTSQPSSPRLSCTSHCGLSTRLPASAPTAGHVIVRAYGRAALGLTVRLWFAVGSGEEGSDGSNATVVPAKSVGHRSRFMRRLRKGGAWSLGLSAIQSSHPCFTHTVHPLCQPPQIQQQRKHGLSLRDSCPCVWGGN